MPDAFVSQQIVTPDAIRSGAVLVDNGKITAIVDAAVVPSSHRILNCPGALLPGLVDSHIHINEPGRTEWEGFATATRAAAAGGYTTLIDMPLNCLPATTTVAALEAKRTAANGQCLVDWAAWGGVSAHNADHIEPLARVGVRGFKCFLAEPGIDGFSRVDETELRIAAPHLARTGLPLLVHAELPEPLDRASREMTSGDWRRYETWLRSRPDEAEVEAIRLMIRLCREFGFPPPHRPPRHRASSRRSPPRTRRSASPSLSKPAPTTSTSPLKPSPTAALSTNAPHPSAARRTANNCGKQSAKASSTSSPPTIPPVRPQ